MWNEKIISILSFANKYIYAVNFQTEIDAKYQSDFEESTLPISLKLTGNYLDDNIFSEFQIKGSEDDLL